MLEKLRLLEEEDPLLHVVYDEAAREIRVQLMGEVQLEILECLCRSRFGLEITFGEGGILYRETIAAPVEGVGHYEPLRTMPRSTSCSNRSSAGAASSLRANARPMRSISTGSASF